MRKLVVSEFVSLDGVMEAPGGDDGYVHGPWTVPYWGDDLAEYKSAELFAADALLLGRVTYSGFAAAWPERSGDPFSDHMNSMAKYVVSETLTQASWAPSTILRGDLGQIVGELKGRDGGDILVNGSCTLVHGLLAADLVDELRLAIYPLTLGIGKRLLDAGARLNFELVECRSTASGVLLTTYRRSDGPAARAFDYEAMISRDGG
jgi:dihydrofolate reductase